MPDEPRHPLDAWLARHHGVVSRGQMLALDITSSAIQRTLARGTLSPIRRGIYLSAAHPLGREQLMVAGCLLHPMAAIGFTTAGQKLRFRRMGDDLVHVLVPHDCTATMPGVVVHRCRRIDPVDLTRARTDGIRLTSPPRTILDAAGLIGREATTSVVEQALAERRCTLATLMSTARRLHHPRRPGSMIFRDVLLSRPALRVAARSDLEVRAAAAIERRGLPAPAVNLPFVIGPGDCVVLDLAWPAFKLAVEVDHPFWHDGIVEARRDKRRDRRLAALGWQTLRVTEWDIEHDVDAMADEIGGVLVARGWLAATLDNPT
ncbi:MAG: type IV toxin-antitoxin system AbiEi family antitoxin domain-containing protein [Acidimicrobiia bacterium]|nr:type IV toxin-antitoxin system AbiEi family antitoxin domain-containing protein [Acidimicrobiia bacterium]